MQIEALLARHGLPLLGCADTAFAFERDGEAFKIGFDPDDGWPAWAAWCADHPSPHVPRVRWLRWIEDRRGSRVLFAAQVERLFSAELPRQWIKPRPHLKRDPIALAALIGGEHPSIAKLLRDARLAFPHGHFDLGAPNWLKRADGTLVLNDPLSRADTRGIKP